MSLLVRCGVGVPPWLFDQARTRRGTGPSSLALSGSIAAAGVPQRRTSSFVGAVGGVSGSRPSADARGQESVAGKRCGRLCSWLPFRLRRKQPSAFPRIPAARHHSAPRCHRGARCALAARVPITAPLPGWPQELPPVRPGFARSSPGTAAVTPHRFEARRTSHSAAQLVSLAPGRGRICTRPLRNATRRAEDATSCAHLHDERPPPLWAGFARHRARMPPAPATPPAWICSADCDRPEIQRHHPHYPQQG